jgi:hypothetical protein
VPSDNVLRLPRPVIEAPAVGPAAHEEQQVQVVPVAQPSAGIAGLDRAQGGVTRDQVACHDSNFPAKKRRKSSYWRPYCSGPVIATNSMSRLGQQKSPRALILKGFLDFLERCGTSSDSNLVAWGGIEPPTRGFSNRCVRQQQAALPSVSTTCALLDSIPKALSRIAVDTWLTASSAAELSENGADLCKIRPRETSTSGAR